MTNCTPLGPTDIHLNGNADLLSVDECINLINTLLTNSWSAEKNVASIKGFIIHQTYAELYGKRFIDLSRWLQAIQKFSDAGWNIVTVQDLNTFVNDNYIRELSVFKKEPKNENSSTKIK